MPELRRGRTLALLPVPQTQQPIHMPELRIHGALGDSVGEVIVTIRLMPESIDIDLKQLEAEVRSRIKVYSIEREPIAFGLEALLIMAIIPDSAGGTDPLEEALARIPGVANVQVIDVRRAL